MSHERQLKGRRALVTGGTKGVGEAVVARLLDAGVKVLTTARSFDDDPADAMFVAADVTTPAGCAMVAELSASALAASTSLSTSSAARPRRPAASRCSTTTNGKRNSTSICSQPCALTVRCLPAMIEGLRRHRPLLHLQLGPDRPNVTRPQRWLRAEQLPFFPRQAASRRFGSRCIMVFHGLSPCLRDRAACARYAQPIDFTSGFGPLLPADGRRASCVIKQERRSV